VQQFLISYSKHEHDYRVDKYAFVSLWMLRCMSVLGRPADALLSPNGPRVGGFVAATLEALQVFRSMVVDGAAIVDRSGSDTLSRGDFEMYVDSLDLNDDDEAVLTFLFFHRADGDKGEATLSPSLHDLFKSVLERIAVDFSVNTVAELTSDQRTLPSAGSGRLRPLFKWLLPSFRCPAGNQYRGVTFALFLPVYLSLVFPSLPGALPQVPEARVQRLYAHKSSMDLFHYTEQFAEEKKKAAAGEDD
jgi:hypothetical protein